MSDEDEGSRGPEGSGEDEHRRRAIDLLEANHSFPCDFSLSVIARNDEAVALAIVSAVSAVAPLGEGAHERLPSGGGKYVSHRLVVRCITADAVLELFARVREVEGVITIL